MKPELVKCHVLGTTARMVTGKVVKLPTWVFPLQASSFPYQPYPRALESQIKKMSISSLDGLLERQVGASSSPSSSLLRLLLLEELRG